MISQVFFLQWYFFQKHTLANHAANLYETIDFPFRAFFGILKVKNDIIKPVIARSRKCRHGSLNKGRPMLMFW